MNRRPRTAVGMRQSNSNIYRSPQGVVGERDGRQPEEAYLFRVWDKAASQELAQMLDMRGYEAEAVVRSQRRAYPQIRSRPLTSSRTRKRGHDGQVSPSGSKGFPGVHSRPRSSFPGGSGRAAPTRDVRFEDNMDPWNEHNFRDVLSATPASSAEARHLATTLSQELKRVFPRSKVRTLSDKDCTEIRLANCLFLSGWASIL